MKNIFYFLSLFLCIGITSCSSDDDGGNTKETPKNNAKAITSFAFNSAVNEGLNENITAVINENDKTITAAVPYGTDITALVPTIKVSEGATVSPEGEQDFSSEVTYTVTAEDGTKADYIVTVTITPSNEAKILSFAFLAENNTALEEDVTATIDEEAKTITAEVSYGTDVTGLIPTLEVSTNATFTPEGAQDFTSEVVYTVTAQDGTIAEYTLQLTIALSQREVLIAIYNANPGNTLGWDLDDPDINNWKGVVADENGYVTVLNIANRNLINIPVEMGQLSMLSSLNLYSNQLTSVPAEIGQLVNLEYLYLYNNQLTSVPAEIGQLAHLKTLYLYNNQLTFLPAEIGQLANLTSLDLENNQLKSLPAEIGQLSNLIVLYLNTNQLTSVPAEIGQLSNLTDLYLSDNQLINIPQEVCDLNTNYGTAIHTDEGVTCQ